MWHRVALRSGIALLFAPSLAWASDGEPDVDNAYPAVGFYYVAFNYPGGPLETYGGCSGTLITEDVFMTAGHCTFYDTRRLVEEPAYEKAEAWVSFAPVALENDFRCYLQDIGYPGADDLPCDAITRNYPRFERAHSAGITHPDYPTIRTKGNGSLLLQEPVAPHNTDLAVLLLEMPVIDVTPLGTAPLRLLDDPNLSGTAVVGAGYGLHYHKSIPATPEQPGGDGPTNFLGEYGVRRVADLGTIRSVTPEQITPTQQNTHGDDSVCYWDSGSPLFLVRDGVVEQTVVGVLTGGALWCMGAYDPYRRVDTSSVIEFLHCVKAAPTARDACRCGVEDRLGLCDDL